MQLYEKSKRLAMSGGVFSGQQEDEAASSDSFLTAFGQRDSHALELSNGVPNPSRSAGQPYTGIRWPQILEMAATPSKRSKHKAQFLIPSSYRGYDGRTHHVQRERGLFGVLAVDIDRGNPSCAQLVAAIRAIVGAVEALIYTSASATPDDRKWRVFLPLAKPLPGVEYQDTQMALFDLFGEMGIMCDPALSRVAQPVYLPNVPAERRDPAGRPLFYETRHLTGARLDLYRDTPIVRRREEKRLAAARMRAAEVARQADYQRQRLEYRQATGDDFEPIAHFNQHHSIRDLFLRYQFVPDPRSSRDDWRSPLSESGSYSTQIRGDHWVCVSAWPHKYNVGRETKNGARVGDAFDLFTYFEHGGDKRAAVLAYVQEVRPKRDHDLPTRTRSGQFTGKKSIEVAPAPPPEFLEASEVSAQLTEVFSDGLEMAAHWYEDGQKGTAPTQVIRASPGSGKTRTALQSLVGFNLSRVSGDVIFYTPTLALADEASQVSQSLGLGSHVTRGRGAKNPNTGAPMCARAELAAAAAEAGLSIKATLCERKVEDGSVIKCPYHGICSGARSAEPGEPNPSYLRQWNSLGEGPELRFESHQYLLSNGDGSERKVGLRIVDEKTWHNFIRETILLLEDWVHAGVRPPPRGLSSRKKARWDIRVEEAADRQCAAREVAEALRAGVSPVLEKYTAEDFDAFAAVEERHPTVLDILPDAHDAELKDAIGKLYENRNLSWRRALLWRFLAHAKREGRIVIERLQYLPHWKGSSGKEDTREALSLHWLVSFPDTAPVILLDADADPVIVERMHPGTRGRVSNIDMKPNAEVIQVDDRAFTQQSLMKSKKLRARCVGVIRAEIAKERVREGGLCKVLVVASKAIVRQMFEDAGALPSDITDQDAVEYMKSTELHGARWLWYGPGSLGLNDYENFRTVIAIGRQELPYDALENKARALFGDRGEPLHFLERSDDEALTMPLQTVPYLMADGSGRAAEIPAHSDPRIFALQQQNRECALRQAVERLRLSRATEPKRVLLLTKIPLPDFPVTELVSFEELAPPRLIAALHEAEGLLRLSAAGLAADAPESFTTAKAAAGWLSREGKTVVNTPEPYVKDYYRCGGINVVLASMRLVGQRGPHPTPVLIAVPGDPHEAVAARYGDLADFRVLRVITRRSMAAAPSDPVSQSPAEKAAEAKPPITPSTKRALRPTSLPSEKSPEASQAPATSNQARSEHVSIPVLPQIVSDGLSRTCRGAAPAQIPSIKPSSAAERVLLAIKKGSKTPGALASATKLGMNKCHLTLKQLLRFGYIRERRDGTFELTSRGVAAALRPANDTDLTRSSAGRSAHSPL